MLDTIVMTILTILIMMSLMMIITIGWFDIREEDM
jgi:hypothetical protein